MSIWSCTKITILPILAISLTGCLSSQSYQPSANAQTAKMSYDIDTSSFYSPNRFIDRGFIERIDIQLKHSRVGTPDTINMELKDLGSFRPINIIEANKPLTFTYEHKVVKGLGDWPLLCVVAVNATLTPNGNYVLKGNTTTEKFRSKTNFMGEKIEAEDTSCQVQIIDTQSNKVIGEGRTQKFEKMIPIYNRF